MQPCFDQLLKIVKKTYASVHKMLSRGCSKECKVIPYQIKVNKYQTSCDKKNPNINNFNNNVKYTNQ